MTTSAVAIEEVGRLVAAREEQKALQALRELLATSGDPELRRAVHEVALKAHESSHGFQKIEWHRLMLETE